MKLVSAFLLFATSIFAANVTFNGVTCGSTILNGNGGDLFCSLLTGEMAESQAQASFGSISALAGATGGGGSLARSAFAFASYDEHVVITGGSGIGIVTGIYRVVDRPGFPSGLPNMTLTQGDDASGFGNLVGPCGGGIIFCLSYSLQSHFIYGVPFDMSASVNLPPSAGVFRVGQIGLVSLTVGGLPAAYAVVPEPSAAMLLGLGLIPIVISKLRRR